MATLKIIELMGSSPNSWQEAAGNALTEATKTVKNITGLELLNTNAKVKDGKITEYRAQVKIAFVVDENE
ncbi:dodecin domain-containing protein [bacterium]|nr:dodecin domain-containing protein [bacterium]